MRIFILLEAALKNVLIATTANQQGIHHQTQTNGLLNAEKHLIGECREVEKTFKTVALSHSATAP